VNLTIWGEVIPGAILTKCRMWGDTVDVITCGIFRDCRLRGVGVVRGVSLPSPIDLTCRPYNTGHRVIQLLQTDTPDQHGIVSGPEQMYILLVVMAGALVSEVWELDVTIVHWMSLTRHFWQYQRTALARQHARAA